MKKTEWYDTKFNLIFLSGSLLLLPLSIVLYRFYIIRIGIILILGICIFFIAFLLRKKIYSSLKLRSAKPLLDTIETLRRKLKL